MDTPEIRSFDPKIEQLIISLRGKTDEDRQRMLVQWLESERGKSVANSEKIVLSSDILKKNETRPTFDKSRDFLELGHLVVNGKSFILGRTTTQINLKIAGASNYLSYEVTSGADFRTVADIVWFFEPNSTVASNSHREISGDLRDRGLGGVIFRLSEQVLKDLGIKELRVLTAKPATAGVLISLGYSLEDVDCCERVLREIKNNLGNFTVYFSEDCLSMKKNL